MSVHDLYLLNRKPYTPSARSTTATGFVPDPIINKKREFVPIVLKQIGGTTRTRTETLTG